MWLLLPFALTLIILKHVLILTQGCKLTMMTLVFCRAWMGLQVLLVQLGRRGIL